MTGATMTDPAPRALPAPAAARTNCEGCLQPIVWARTVAGPNGPGGKLMPLDPIEDPEGNVAVTRPAAGLLARVLGRDERADRPAEYVANTHFATCPTRTRPAIPLSLLQPHTASRGRRHPGVRQ